MQDIEFTVEQGDLYILQTRDGKRTGPAALKIAVDMVEDDLVSKARAVRDLVEPRHLDQLLHPQFKDADAYANDVLGKGIPASPGAAVGRVVFTADAAEAWNERGEDVILVRIETSPEDVGGMDAAEDADLRASMPDGRVRRKRSDSAWPRATGPTESAPLISASVV